MTTPNDLEKKIGYLFQDSRLLVSALTHRSKHKTKNNERLEFLGDSVLSLIISAEIYHSHHHLREGELSRLRAALVKGETIAKIALKLGIGDCLQLGSGELKSGGQKRESILAGAFEALIGAIFADSNYKITQQCVLKWYCDLIHQIEDITDVKDAKTTLQEWLQKRKLPLPVYECDISGSAHSQQFTVTCHVTGLSHETKGVSTNRRKAEQMAAKEFLSKVV